MNDNFETRLKYLNDKIDTTFGILTGNYTNFTENFTANNYLRLKLTLSDINNVLTLKLTLAFVDTLCEKFSLSDDIKVEWKNKIDSIGPNTKGFDIDFETPIKVLTEIKCITTEKNSFSASQKNNLFNDAIKLKYKDCKTDQSDYYKFIVVLDCGDTTNKCIEALINYKSKKITDERSKRMLVLNDVIFIKENFNKELLNKDKIYILKQKI